MATKSAADTIIVNTFTDGIIDPDKEFLGPVKAGGTIRLETAPGCWGPMITPELKGGHEVTQPVYVEGTEPGDAVAIHIEDIEIVSKATASGADNPNKGHYLGDPFVLATNPVTGKKRPKTVVQGVGPDAIRDAETGESVSPFSVSHGYTMVFDEARTVGVTVGKEAAEKIGANASEYSAKPKASIQHSILVIAPHDLVGLPTRLRPFLGQLGTAPSKALPDSHNAGDFGQFLVGAPHEYAITPEELDEHRTDGHLDIDAVRAGAILVAPVKVPGAGVYAGDMHANQGDGEIAGHTTDVAGNVTLRVDVLKGRTLEGPVLFPVEEDLPFLAKPLTAEERRAAEVVAREHGITELEVNAPISVIGTGANLNDATNNGLERAAKLLNMPVGEVQNRATVAGAIEIGRHPGVVQVTFLAPVQALKDAGFGEIIAEQYGITG